MAIVASTEYLGGAELYIARLASLLHNEGMNVRLIGSLRSWPCELPQDDPGFGSKWSLRTLPLGLLRSLSERRRLKGTLRSTKAKVFNCHFKREQIALTSVLARNGRVVWTEHGLFPSGIFGFLIRPLYWFAARNCSEIVCVSDRVALSILPRVPRGTPIRTIASAVDLSRWNSASEGDAEAARRELGISNTSRVCVFVGRLDPGKRPDLAIEAALASRSTIVLAGDGAMAEALKQRYRDNERVLFLGHTADLRFVYSAANFHLFTSNGKGEGFPTVLLEAAASAVPTVACDDAGFSAEILRAGGKVARPTVSELSRAIEGMTVIQERRDAARAWAMTRDLEGWIRSYSEVFRARNDAGGGVARQIG
ncbi:glycosyltransferase family 4 protein [Arthrobacter sp. TMS1-12-1]